MDGDYKRELQDRIRIDLIKYFKVAGISEVVDKSLQIIMDQAAVTYNEVRNRSQKDKIDIRGVQKHFKEVLFNNVRK